MNFSVATSKKTKEIKDNLQGFDRLNVMSLENSSSDDSTAVNSPTKKSSKAAVNALDTAATAIEKRTNKVFDSIKRALNNLKNAFVSIGESWKRVWKNGTGEKIIGNIKQLLKNVFDIIGDISGAFTKAWNKARLGDEVVASAEFALFVSSVRSVISELAEFAELSVADE